MIKISVKKNGPYIVEGHFDLFEETIIKNGILVRKKTSKTIRSEKISLCRCGKSYNSPVCDGTHSSISFDGTTVASKETYLDRAVLQVGPDMSLLDDNRCAFARFCHREHGDVWTLTDNSDVPKYKKEAEEGASACPAGRLTAIVDDKIIKDNYPTQVTFIQDPLKNCSAGLFIQGDFLISDEKSFNYEKRNRVSLCRCGASENKPFCDACHVNSEFQDKNYKQ